MKKHQLLLALSTLFVLASCGGNNPSSPSVDSDASIPSSPSVPSEVESEPTSEESIVREHTITTTLQSKMADGTMVYATSFEEVEDGKGHLLMSEDSSQAVQYDFVFNVDWTVNIYNHETHTPVGYNKEKSDLNESEYVWKWTSDKTYSYLGGTDTHSGNVRGLFVKEDTYNNRITTRAYDLTNLGQSHYSITPTYFYSAEDLESNMANLGNYTGKLRAFKASCEYSAVYNKLDLSKNTLSTLASWGVEVA